MLNEQQFYLCVQIQTSQTGGPPYSDSSPYGECSLLQVSIFFLLSLYFRYSLLSVRLPFNLNASLTNPGRKIQPFGKFIPLGVSSKLALSSYPDVLKWGGGSGTVRTPKSRFKVPFKSDFFVNFVRVRVPAQSKLIWSSSERETPRVRATWRNTAAQYLKKHHSHIFKMFLLTIFRVV